MPYTTLDDAQIESLDDMSLAREHLKASNRALEISEQTRVENAEGKQAQRVDTLNAAQERTISAQFSMAKALGSVASGITMGFVAVADDDAKRNLQPVIAALGGVFTVAMGLYEAQRVLTQSSRQLAGADKAMIEGEFKLRQELGDRAPDVPPETTTTSSARVPTGLIGGPA